MLPRETYARLLTEHQTLGLRMTLGSEKRVFFFRVEVAEGPDDLMSYSLGAAAAQATAGTAWSEITDSQGRYHLEPENEKVIYHGFFGVSPGQAWIYKQYPTGRDLNSLLGVRTIGSGVGHIDGIKSPAHSPSPITEFLTMKGIHPGFLGYHPYTEPSSITVRLHFYVTRYDVAFLGTDPSGTDEDQKRKIVESSVREKAKVRSVGGRDLVPIPSWVESALKA